MSNEIDMVSLARQLLPTRGDYQLELEDNIVTFNGDALEVHDMLDAFKKSLKDRYGEDQLTDVLEAFKDLQEALLELDHADMPMSEQDMKEWIADQDPREFK